MKRTMLILYPRMMIGGSTTALLSLLNSIDYNKYDVELMLFYRDGELETLINPNVKVITAPSENKLIRLKPDNIYRFVKSRIFSTVKKNRYIRGQVMSKVSADCRQKTETEYDYAIAYLENLPSRYLQMKVKHAKKKIAWIHLDYLGARLCSRLDLDMYQEFDRIVTVSEICHQNFKKCFPACESNTVMLENILDPDIVRKRAMEETDVLIEKDDRIRLVSCSRIDYFHKGLDRLLNACAKMKKKQGYLPFVWYVIGDGQDRGAMEAFIQENDLSDTIKCLGAQKNPYPLLKQMDILVQPSRYEGKPMVVTEAQILGVIPCVTAYASAGEQICDNVDGWILLNNDDSIEEYLMQLCQGKHDLDAIKKALKKKDFSPNSAIVAFDKMLEAI